MLDNPMFLPFYEAMAETDLTLGVHVGWACPSLNNLYSELYPSWLTAFLMPVMMGFVAFMTGGTLDRFPNLRVVFLEAGCLWIPFVIDRLNHRFPHARRLAQPLSADQRQRRRRARRNTSARGNLYWSAEVEDGMLPPGHGPGGGRGRSSTAPSMPHSDAGTLRGQDAVGAGRCQRVGEEGRSSRATPRALYGL